MIRAALRSVATAVAAALVLAVAPPALAADPVVTLDAAPTTLPFGASTTFSGSVDPSPGAGQTVHIVDADTDAPVTEATTDGAGAFAATFAPSATARYVARYLAADSDPVRVRVRAVVRASLSKVFLFGRTRVAGRVRPPRPGERVEVLLRRGRKVVARRWARQDANGRFVAGFPVRLPGRYRAVARFSSDDLLAGRHVTGPRRTPLPRLRPGSRGLPVLHLERRLRSLGYHIRGVNRVFDRRSADAVMAFHKVQGMRRVGAVRPATWRRMARPHRPRPQAAKPAFHIEIDQTRQVLYVVRRGRITDIVHTSTGRNNYMRNGVFRVHRKIAGYSPGRLYYPSYFDGLRAVHGWPQVPPYNASAGCSRVPNWTAIWLHDIMPHGTVVRVYGRP